MEMERNGNTIIMKGKELDSLDRLVLDFVKLMPFDYVIISGYAAIPKEVRKFCIEVENESHMTQALQDLKRDGYNDGIRSDAMSYARGFSWAKTAFRTAELYKLHNC